MRQFIFTASIMTGLILSSCAKDPQNDIEVSNSPEPVLKLAESAPQDISHDENAKAPKTAAVENDPSELPERYQGLNPIDISRAEIDEHIKLLELLNQNSQKYHKTLSAWNQEDPTRRGPRPIWTPSVHSEEDSKRFRILETKLQKATSRKKYEAYIPKTLSHDEVNELIALEQAQRERQLEQQEKAQAWAKMDPATRGPHPSAASLFDVNPRLMELQGKIQNANKIERLTQRIDKLGASHNISLTDSQISELSALEAENQKIMLSFSKAMIDAQKNSQLNGAKVSPNEIINKLPKHLLQGMMETQMRIQAIEGPLKAAEKAEQLKNNLTKLSQESGVAILQSEIDETIALHAEKDRIQSNAQRQAMQNWLEEGGDISPNSPPMINDEDYARIKEIDARIKAISAPMTEAKEANNPALREQRLKQEEQLKWMTVWQEKKRAGEIPQDTPLNSPTYAQVQDRVENYSTTLKSRADKVGYVVPEADVERLNSLNDEMLDIRKRVYDMEVDGSAMVDSGHGYKLPDFKLTSSMHKIRLIEKKQRQILAGLSEAESFQNGTSLNQSSEIGTRQFNRRDVVYDSGQYGARNGTGAEDMIESFRARGINVSQADADDLIAFEQELEGR